MMMKIHKLMCLALGCALAFGVGACSDPDQITAPSPGTPTPYIRIKQQPKQRLRRAPGKNQQPEVAIECSYSGGALHFVPSEIYTTLSVEIVNLATGKTTVGVVDDTNRSVAVPAGSGLFGITAVADGEYEFAAEFSLV